MPISVKAIKPALSNTNELGEKGNLFSQLFEKRKGCQNFHFQVNPNVKTIVNRVHGAYKGIKGARAADVPK